MRKCSLIVLLALLLGVCMNAQDKLVTSSASRPPEWIGLSIADYIISAVQAKSLTEAKEMAITDIRKQIVSAIAVNITSSSESSSHSETVDGKETYLRSYHNVVTSNAAALPFVSGISLSDNVESYWEKRYIKDKDTYYYFYHVKYHFPKARLMRLIAEYKALDEERWSKYLALKDAFGTFTSVDFIPQAVNELSALTSWFEKGYRKSSVEALIKSYKDSYSAIVIVPVENVPGSFTYKLQLNGRDIKCSTKPSLKSEYARELEWFESGDNLCHVTYTYDGVREYDKKEILINHRFGPSSVRYVVHFKLK